MCSKFFLPDAATAATTTTIVSKMYYLRIKTSPMNFPECLALHPLLSC